MNLLNIDVTNTPLTTAQNTGLREACTTTMNTVETRKLWATRGCYVVGLLGVVVTLVVLRNSSIPWLATTLVLGVIAAGMVIARICGGAFTVAVMIALVGVYSSVDGLVYSALGDRPITGTFSLMCDVVLAQSGRKPILAEYDAAVAWIIDRDQQQTEGDLLAQAQKACERLTAPL